MKVTDPRRLGVQVVDRVLRLGSYADILLDDRFLKFGFNRKDRAFASELVYGTIRWLLTLDWILQKAYTGKWHKVPSIVKRILEIGLYQILFLDRVPAYAAIDESVTIAKERANAYWGGVVNGILRNISRDSHKLLPSEVDNSLEALSIRYSHPQWMIEKWIALWGVERTKSICQANNQRPHLGVRINCLKTSRDDVLKELRRMEKDAEISELLNTFITIERGGEVFSSSLFHDGNITIQDVSAGLVGYLVAPKPGEHILDVAAAPGGKTTQMGEICHDSAVICAMDIHEKRIEKIRSNIRRLNLSGIHCVTGDGNLIPFKGMDRVLVDSPCSGLGVLNKRSEIRWRCQPEDIRNLVQIQKGLLHAASEAVKTDGILVYSTCTILPEENSEIVEEFIGSHSNFIVEDASRFVPEEVVSKDGFIETWPDKHGIDGSFAVRFRKTG